MKPSLIRSRQHTAIWCICILLAATPWSAAARAGGSEDDDHVLLQLDKDDSAEVHLKALEVQLGRDVTGCDTLPVRNWVSCKLAPAAVANAAEANRIVATMASLQLRSIFSGSAGATASAAGTPRRAFRRVGRGKRVFISARQLKQQDPTAAAVDQAIAAATADAAANGANTAGTLPKECANGSCGRLWGMDRIGAPAVWRNMGKGMPLKRITRPMTIIDTGADVFNWNVGPQIDKDKSITITVNQQRSASSEGGRAGVSSHGTHVFGTAAGAWGGTDASGVAGVLGPVYNSIVSCNVFGNNGDSDGATINDIVRCLAHARRNNAHWVVNLSLGGDWARNDAVVELLKEGLNTHVCDAGGIVIAAAHNQAQNVDNPSLNKATYPAAYAGNDVPCLIAVASIEQGDKLSVFSNFGNSVQIAAPGSNIFSAVNSNGGSNVWAAGEMSGTSMASPHVAGAAALLMNAFPDATGAQVKGCMLSTATDPVRVDAGRTAPLGGGILNVKAAYDCLAQALPPNCQSQTVPPCVHAPSGVLDPSCQPGTSRGTYCLELAGGQKCKYTLKPAGRVCNSTTGMTCTGTRAACPRKAASGKTEPTIADCSTDKLQKCEVPGLCTADQGCKCNSVRQALSQGCTCASNLGFASISDPATGFSRCRWNVSFAGLGVISVPLDARVSLPLRLAGGTMCPPGGSKLIKSISIGEQVQCDVQPLTTLSATSDAFGESCGQFVLNTAKAGAVSGSCYRLRVQTTDVRNYNLVVMYQ